MATVMQNLDTRWTAPVHSVRPRNIALLIFCTSALFVAMSIRQEATPEVGGLVYWLLVIPAIILPLTNPIALSQAAVGRASLVIVMALMGGLWNFVRGDMTAAMQIVFFCLPLVWFSASSSVLYVKDLTSVYICLLVVGLVIFLTTDINRWGPIPGTTDETYGVWRVSFYPNIANTAFLSLAMLLLLGRSSLHAIWKKPAFLIALYFVIFSFVRTALVGAIVFFALRYLFKRYNSANALFYCALTTAVGVNLLIVFTPSFFAAVQNNALVSRIFLRNETGLSTFEIYQQLYRPWLWAQQLDQFFTSPWLMGWGSIDFNILKTDELVLGLDQGDTVSLPTRMLSMYGLTGVVFLILLTAQLRHLARKRDAWGCAVFPVVFLSMMQWGSFFHPSDGLNVLYMLMILRGSDGFEFQFPAMRTVLAAPQLGAAPATALTAN